MINMLSEIDQTESMLAAPQNFIPVAKLYSL
jgi:hypothetical protein